MKLFYSILIIATTLFVGCSSDPVLETQEKKPIIQTIITVDSSAYFDSIYAANVFKIDTFFQHRFDRKTFNGSILFAYNNQTIIKKTYGFSTLET